jgi:hypothetical protein
MGQFSMEISLCAGSALSGNQQRVSYYTAYCDLHDMTFDKNIVLAVPPLP